MSEQLNQVGNEVNEFNEESMFDFEDLTGETNEELNDSEDQIELPDDENNPASSEDNQNGDEESFIDIVYNGESKKLSKEETITLAQKGMNYDKVNENLQNLRNSKELQMLNRMAQESGLSPTDYLTKLDNFQKESFVNKVYAQLKERCPDAPDNLLLENASNYVNQQVQARNEEQYRLQQMEQQKEEEFYSNQIELFTQKYPDVDLAKLPGEVLLNINKGMPLVAAYQDYENSQLRKEIETLKLNNKNKTVSPGSLKGNQTAENESDPFLQGFFGK
ncbi:MAG: hypothetical protein ACK5L6_03920 [Anaerorhabdus sp.]|uniref:hypothetical protein n=1 Tax=Anaerorhabdus sp. TaxID=1872524 RepID=UPI003A89EE5E